MNRKTFQVCFMTLCLLLLVSRPLQATGKPDVTRHEAQFLGGALNMQVEWQSPNPVVLVKISVANVQKEIKIDPYDNKRNRDGYAGEVNVTLKLDWVTNQSFSYVIQLEDELQIKSPPVTGKVKISPSQQPTKVIQPQQPAMQIQIQQNVPQPQPGVQPGGQNVGSLTVTIGPQILVGSGAMWRVNSGPWQKSGATVPNLPVGVHAVEFQEVGNWMKPDDQRVMIENGRTTTVNGIYEQ